MVHEIINANLYTPVLITTSTTKYVVKNTTINILSLL